VYPCIKVRARAEAANKFGLGARFKNHVTKALPGFLVGMLTRKALQDRFV